MLCREQDRSCEHARDDVVEDNSQPATETVISLPDRRGFDDVEEAKQHKTAKKPSGFWRSCQHSHGISGDFVPNDPRMPAHAELARARAADVDAADEREQRKRKMRDPAEV